MTDTYDSTEETKDHISRVREFMDDVVLNLSIRAKDHDYSKLEEPEKTWFDKFTPKLAELEYGTDEYKQALVEMRPALQHHFEHNSHHPEHYTNGIYGMSLLDIIEMLCDWRAASERTKQLADGDEYMKRSFADSLAYNKSRFSIDDQLYRVLINTARELGFIK